MVVTITIVAWAAIGCLIASLIVFVVTLYRYDRHGPKPWKENGGRSADGSFAFYGGGGGSSAGDGGGDGGGGGGK